MSEPLSGEFSDRVTFSPATAADFDELVGLRIAAMRESLERVGRFDPEQMRASFLPECTEFILLERRWVGLCTLRPVAAGSFHLDHLHVHPDCQSRGVGSFALRRLLAVADARQVPVRLGALRESASNRFYQRHGFVKTGEDECDVYYVRGAEDCQQ